jgi:hypothetical protein
MTRQTEAHGVRLQESHWRRVCAFAARHSVPPTEGLRRLVLLALEQSEGLRCGDRAPLEEGIERLLLVLHRMGPVVVALPHLLAYWATRDLHDEVSTDEFIAEFHANAADAWTDALERTSQLTTIEASSSGANDE